MIEVTVKNAIETYTGIATYMEIPKNHPDTFAIIERVGGSQDEHISYAMISVQIYAPSMGYAAQACDTISQAMLYEAINEPDISSVALNAKYNATDTETKKYRYQAIFDIAFYE